MSDFASIQSVRRDAVRVGLKPPPRLRLSEWANEYFRLSAESAAQAGRWTSLPYQREIMDSITDPKVTHVSVMKSARVGYTLMVSAAVGYFIHQEPVFDSHGSAHGRRREGVLERDDRPSFARRAGALEGHVRRRGRHGPRRTRGTRSRTRSSRAACFRSPARTLARAFGACLDAWSSSTRSTRIRRAPAATVTP
jgi:hypothetical protein